jgi:O-antigen/teichoic acid export membrane protein
MMANAGAVFTSRVIVAVLGWAGTILIIHQLTKNAWGEFSFVFSFLALISVLSNVVNSRVAIHGLLKDDADRFAGSFVLLRGFLGLLTYCIALSFVVLGGYPSTVVQATAIGGLVIVLATPSVALDTVFQFHARMDRTAIAAVVGQVSQFVLTAVLALLGSSLVVFTIPAVLCEIVAMLCKLHWLHHLQRIRYVLETSRWWSMLREAIPIAIGQSAAAAYYAVDSVMLSKMDTFSAVGTYGIAYKFAGVVSFLPIAMSAAALTLLARAWPDNVDAFRHALRRAGTVLLLAAVLIMVMFGLFADQAIRVLYGDAYRAAANATKLVLAGEVLGFFTFLGVTTFAAISRNRLYAVAAIIGLVFNVGLNLVLIPEFSFRGSAWATLATELIVVTMIWVPLTRTVGSGPFSLRVGVMGSLAGACAAAIGFAATLVTPWFVAALITVAAYVALLHVWQIPDRGGVLAAIRDDAPPALVADPQPS